MTKRVPCQTPGCDAMILPETATKTGGYCMPCVQKRAQEARAAYIAAHRQTVDPYAGITDPVELIRLQHIRRPRDPLIHYLPYPGDIADVYQALTHEQIEAVITDAIEHFHQGDANYLRDMCSELMTFRTPDMVRLHQFLLDNDVYYPSLLFRGASTEVTTALLNRVEEDEENRNLILCALAWIGSSDVVATFARWRSTPPDWAEDLYCPPWEYAHEAGWELTPDGGCRNLYFDDCFPLCPSPDGTIEAFGTTDEPCQWCQRPMTTLLNIDLTQPQLAFLPLKADSFAINNCQVCSCFGDPLFVHYDHQGNSHWWPKNTTPNDITGADEEWEMAPLTRFTLGEQRPAWSAADAGYCAVTKSQIGGLPTWEQDSDYPKCPCCHKTMTFIAQIAREETDEYGEGIHYLFICPDCQLSTAGYQQT